MPMKLLTAAEIAADAPRNWGKQYETWAEDRLFADGTTKGEVEARLHSKAPTPEHVAFAINDSWAFPCCSICDARAYAVVVFGNDFSDETVNVCVVCLSKANVIISQVKNGPAPKKGGE